MTEPTLESLVSRTVRLSHVAPRFNAMADQLVLNLRRAMGVPDRAEDDVEQEFRALRGSLDAFFPEFERIYSELLLAYVGRAAPVVLSRLENVDVQAYLRVADRIDAEIAQALQALLPRIGAALGTPRLE